MAQLPRPGGSAHFGEYATAAEGRLSAHYLTCSDDAVCLQTQISIPVPNCAIIFAMLYGLG